MAGTNRVQGGGGRPVRSIRRVADEDLRLAAGQLAVPDDMDAAGVGGHSREAGEPGIREPGRAGEWSVAAVAEAIAAALVGTKRSQLADALRLAERSAAVLVVGCDVGGTVHRLCRVEADEAVEQSPAQVEGLGRVTRRPAGAVHRGGHAGGRAVLWVAGHEAVLPAGTAVCRSVIPGPDI